jgi:hypothetical protein
MAEAPAKVLETTKAPPGRSVANQERQVVQKPKPSEALPTPQKTDTKKEPVHSTPLPAITSSTYRPISWSDWYGASTICFVAFTSILAPLLVEFIKHQLGLGRRQSQDADMGVG